MQQSHSAQHAPQSVRHMLNSYFELKCENRKSDPLDWWVKEGGSKFPSLFQMATKYLSVLGASVPSGYIFSTAGEVISNRRNRLGDNSANVIISMHTNLT